MRTQGVKWLLSLCLSHMANNAGENASLVILGRFWSLTQKVFAQSDNAKAIFEQVTGLSWCSYSDTRWYSKYECLSINYIKFQFLPQVYSKLAEKKISIGNSGKLLEMVTHESTSRYLATELS